MLISLLFLLYFCSDLRVCDVRVIWMINVVINALYYDICSYILITIDNITSCMYCDVHVGAPGLYLNQVWQSVDEEICPNFSTFSKSFYDLTYHLYWIDIASCDAVTNLYSFAHSSKTYIIKLLKSTT
jgi:hypothetical protein